AFAAGSGGRITAVATLPMQDPEAAVTELRRTVTGLGMRGAEIGPDVAGTPLDDPGPRTVLAAAADLGVPLILHPYYLPAPPRPRGLLPAQPDRHPAGPRGLRGRADLRGGAGRARRAAAGADPRRRLPAVPDRQAGPRAPGPARGARLRASPVGVPAGVLVRH